MNKDIELLRGSAELIDFLAVDGGSSYPAKLRALADCMEQQSKAEPVCKIVMEDGELCVQWLRDVVNLKMVGATLFTHQQADVSQVNARDAERYRWLRNKSDNWYIGPQYETYNDIVVKGEYANHFGKDLDAAIAAAIAAKEGKE